MKAVAIYVFLCDWTRYYHQQYLDKNPNGYCPAHSTGVSCPIGLGVSTGTGVKAETTR